MLHLGSSKSRHWTEVTSLAHRRHQRRLLLHLHSGGEVIMRRVENNGGIKRYKGNEVQWRGLKQRLLDGNQVLNSDGNYSSLKGDRSYGSCPLRELLIFLLSSYGAGL